MIERYQNEVTALLVGSTPVREGIERLPDGRLRVTVVSKVSDVKAEMVDWWFGYMRTTADYKLWHPEDHEWMDWDEIYAPGRYVGASHLVHERIGGRLQKLRVHFLDPRATFGTLFSDCGYQLALCARTGMLRQPLDVGYLLHLVQNTETGCEMTSRFWLGDIGARDLRYVLSAWMANRRLIRRRMTPDALGEDLARHCREEMENLKNFLPELWANRLEAGVS